MSKFIIVNEFNKKGSFPIDWSILSSSDTFLNKISNDLYNVLSSDSSGNIIEKTVVFIEPVDEFPGNVDTIELGDGVIIGKEVINI